MGPTSKTDLAAGPTYETRWPLSPSALFSSSIHSALSLAVEGGIFEFRLQISSNPRNSVWLSDHHFQRGLAVKGDVRARGPSVGTKRIVQDPAEREPDCQQIQHAFGSAV